MTGGIGYAVASTATAEGTTGDLTVQPSISKYVKQIPGGDGDQYELHLTASGDRVAAAPADIVIVADKSLSMNDDGRDTNSKKAVKELAGKLLTEQNKELPENQQIRMAVVTFSTNAQLKQEFTTDAQQIASAMTQPPDGGTNWEAALAQANKLSSGRQGVKKYIIFLSDGDPTYRTTSFGACYSQDWSGGGGNSNPTIALKHHAPPRANGTGTSSTGTSGTRTSGWIPMIPCPACMGKAMVTNMDTTTRPRSPKLTSEATLHCTS
ncbi:von Willebrand factor A [Bifidobacterium thermophilum RBL67]|uniref:von Willebrand factor A n=3 Tax=Bifidobacterium thermophilum TaxID=33905 RepID=M4RD14_9BIFI|nr:vWA domain-containing protein [Bifidobacterium thermophilum]AGH40408.1 von Willebrand factor A [Bifidobacterium thermophilum RBL67]